MSQPQHTYVQYFIPHDGDSEEHPNVFLVKKPPKSLCLGDVQQTFPLPGQYFFRAKQAFGKAHIWMDLNNPEDSIPVFNNKYVLKVSRITASTSSSSSVAVPTSSTNNVRNSSSSTGSAATATRTESTTKPPVALTVSGTNKPSSSSSSSQSLPTTVSDHHHDLLGVFDSGSSSSSNSASTSTTTTDPFAAPPMSTSNNTPSIRQPIPSSVPSSTTASSPFVNNMGGNNFGLDPFAAATMNTTPRPTGNVPGQRTALNGNPIPNNTNSNNKGKGGAFGDLDIFNM